MNEHLSALPAPIVERLRQEQGGLFAVEPLGGMSQGRVFRVRFAAQSLIVKRTAGRAESAFYRQIVPRWSGPTRHIPALHWALESEDEWWLALEDIPPPLPPSRRLADAELLRSSGNSTATSYPQWAIWPSPIDRVGQHR